MVTGRGSQVELVLRSFEERNTSAPVTNNAPVESTVALTILINGMLEDSVPPFGMGCCSKVEYKTVEPSGLSFAAYATGPAALQGTVLLKTPVVRGKAGVPLGVGMYAVPLT